MKIKISKRNHCKSRKVAVLSNNNYRKIVISSRTCWWWLSSGIMLRWATCTAALLIPHTTTNERKYARSPQKPSVLKPGSLMKMRGNVIRDATEKTRWIVFLFPYFQHGTNRSVKYPAKGVESPFAICPVNRTMPAKVGGIYANYLV